MNSNELFYLLLIKDELAKMNISIDDIEDIELKDGNLKIVVNDSMKNMMINFEVE